MRTFYCECGGKAEEISGKPTKCKCGKIFGISGNISDYINMRNTPSGNTKIEFSHQTQEETVKKLRSANV